MIETIRAIADDPAIGAKVGDVIGRREYPECFDVTALASDQVISLSELTTWVSEQDLSKTVYTRYHRDKQGLPWETYRYRHLDTAGKGEDDGLDTGYDESHFTSFGALSQRAVRFDAAHGATDAWSFNPYTEQPEAMRDSLSRLTQYHFTPEVRDQTGAVTTPSTIKVTHPNTRVDINEQDVFGEAKKVDSTAKVSADESETHTQVFTKSPCGDVLKVKKADGTEVMQLVDHQQRPTHQIRSNGHVILTTYDDSKRLVVHTEFKGKIKITPDFMPNAIDVNEALRALANPELNRERYDMQNEAGKPLLVVDEDGYVTAFEYDAFNRQTKKVAYDAQLTDAQLDEVRSGQIPDLPYDAEIDLTEQIFYDDDGLVIAKQDAAGYVTEFKRNGFGKVSEEIHYGTQSPFTRDGSALIPKASPKDSHIVYFYNSQKEISAKVDANQYLTTYRYKPFGKPEKVMHHAMKLATDWRDHLTAGQPTPPAVNAQDRWEAYTYDDAKRETLCDTWCYALDAKGDVDPDTAHALHMLSRSKTYDIDDHNVRTDYQDMQDPDNHDGDHCRSTWSQYDGFDRQSHVANPNVGADLAAAPDDATRAKVWAEESKRTVYSKTGKPILQTDELGFNTHFYYDDQHRLLFHITERLLKSGDEKVGIVTAFTYTDFDEKASERICAKTLALADIPVVVDGLVTDVVLSQLNRDPRSRARCPHTL